MNTLKGDLQKCLPSTGFFYSMTLSSNVQKIVKKKKLNVELLNLIMYMKQMMTQTLKLKLLIIFPCLLINFMIFHKILLKIWLINVYKEKLTASNFYIAAVNKVEPSKKIKSLFYSSVKTSSMKHGAANEIVALTEYVTLLTSQSATINLVLPGFILSKSLPFLGASLDSIVTNVDNLETWGVEINVPHQNLIKVLKMF